MTSSGAQSHSRARSPTSGSSTLKWEEQKYSDFWIIHPYLNFQTAIDADNSALFVIWSVLDYPKGFDLMLNDLPDAIRPLDEVNVLRAYMTHMAHGTILTKDCIPDREKYSDSSWQGLVPNRHLHNWRRDKALSGRGESMQLIRKYHELILVWISESLGWQKWRLCSQEWLQLR